MTQFEEITVDASITNLAGNASINVMAVSWHGTNTIFAIKLYRSVKL